MFDRRTNIAIRKATLLWAKAVVVRVSMSLSVCLSVCVVGLESVEASDMAAVFTRGLKVTVSDPFLAELPYTEFTEHKIQRSTWTIGITTLYKI